MKYIVVSAIKEKVKASGRQITKNALHSLDVKVDTLLEKVCNQFNGNSKRIDSNLINYFKL